MERTWCMERVSQWAKVNQSWGAQASGGTEYEYMITERRVARHGRSVPVSVQRNLCWGDGAHSPGHPVWGSASPMALGPTLVCPTCPAQEE